MRVHVFRQTESMALSGGDVIWVREIPSSRWDLAIGELNDAGALAVLDDEIRVGLQRHGSSPGADGRIHVTIFTDVDAQSLNPEIASSEVAAGMTLIDRALRADSRLGDLFRRYGVVREYVYDYGHGAVLVGDITEDWTVTLR